MSTNVSTPPERPGMVDWYSPSQLIQTGIRAFFSTALGSMIDTRRILAADGEMEDCVFDYSNNDEFSFDYVADTGDGWNSTYTMAYLMTSPMLSVAGEEEPLKRSRVAVLGGDEVYPVASKEAYATRLQSPFDTAAANVRRDAGLSRLPREHMYIVPGNHDWYDGLGSMSRRYFSYYTGDPTYKNDFGRPRRPRKLGQFETHQARSYFILKLPRNWELWAVDVQLGEDIDPQQFAFFSWHAKTIGLDTKVLLCSAVPTIVYGKEHDDDSLVFGLNRISGLVKGKGARTMAQIAGDTHNYERYVIDKKNNAGQPYQRQHIISGGGGAFLHPNHSFHQGTVESPRHEPLMRYPSREESRKLSRRILAFPFKHPGMSLFLGFAYVLLFWTESPTALWESVKSLFAWIFGSGQLDLTGVAGFSIRHPGSLIMMVAAVGGCAAFAGGKKWWGVLHGLVHLLLAFVSWQIGGSIASTIGPGIWEQTIERIATLLVGTVLGGTAFGLYLFVSLNWLRIHHNEAFSSLAWPHHKNFLRCTVENDGSLTIRVVGVESTAGETEQHPVKTHLVEKFVIPGQLAQDES